MSKLPERQAVDIQSYIQRTQTGPCFICNIIAGSVDDQRPVIYEDDLAIVFFSKYQVLYGYTLVAPRKHREQVTGDFTLEEYLALQRVIYRVAEALRLEVQAERLYILSLGSQQGNRHVHWHLAPLPPGVPYDQQQLEALKLERGGLNVPNEELVALASRIRQRMTG